MLRERSHPVPYGLVIPVLVVLGVLASQVVEAVGYTTAKAVSGPWQARVEAYGQVRARADCWIKLPFPVRLTSTGPLPGQAVSAGEVLLRFEAPVLAEAVVSYASARRTLGAAARRLVLVRTNREQRTATRTDVAAAEQDLGRVQGLADAAWMHLRAAFAVLGTGWSRQQVDTWLDGRDSGDLSARLGVLRAPFAGSVVTRAPGSGVWVDANTPLLELEDLSQVYVTVGVSEAELAAWTAGESWILDETDSVLLTPLAGVAGMDSSSGLRLLRYRATNSSGRLHDQQWVDIMHRGRVRSVSWVPVSAVASRDGEDWCLVLAEGKPHPVRVRTGPQQDGRIPVLEGVAEGQEVVTEGAYELLYSDLKQLVKFVD